MKFLEKFKNKREEPLEKTVKEGMI